MIRFGGPVFAQTDDPRELARASKAKGYRAAYVPPMPLGDKERIRETREAFAAEDVMLAEVGYWENLMDINPAVRAKHRKAAAEALALAEEVGARCAVDIFGSYVEGKGDGAYSARNFSAEAFEDAVDLAREIIDAAKPKSACFCYEMFPFAVGDSPESIERLIWAVGRKQFGVHLDLANLVNCPRLYWANADLARECVRRFGNRIVAAHVKDLKMREPAITVIFEEVIAGDGMIDHGAYAKALHGLPQEIPFMLEHLSTEPEYDQAAAWVRARAAEAGIEI